MAPTNQRKTSAASAHQTGSHPAKGATTEPPKPDRSFAATEFCLLSIPWLFSVACMIYAGLAMFFYSRGNNLAAMFFAAGTVAVGAAAVWLFGDRRDD